MMSKLIVLLAALCVVSADHGEDATVARFELNSANNVAGDGVATADESSATGSGSLFWTEDSHQMEWNIEWEGLSSDVTSIQFRGAAAADEASDNVIHRVTDITAPSEGDVTLSDADGQILEGNMVYLVINTVDYPNGEIRGQIENFQAQEVEGSSAKSTPAVAIVTVAVSLATFVLAA